MTNTLRTDSNNVLYEGLRDPYGLTFNAKQASGPIVTDSDGVKSQPQAVAGSFSEIVGQGVGVVNGINTDLFPSTDVSAFKWVSIQIEGTFSATVSWQGSNDNVNFHTIYLWDSTQSGTTGPSSSTGSTGKLYFGPVNFRYFRARMTAFTSNTSLAGTMELYTIVPCALPPSSVTINTPTASGAQNGTSDYHVISAASTNAANIKSSGGVVYGYDLGGNATTDAYVKLYNKASAPTVGTDVPLRTIYVPKATSVNYYNATGINFSNGIAIAVTGAAADTDATAAAAGVAVDIDWK